MHDLSLGIDGAFEWAAAYYQQLSTSFLSIYRTTLPTFTPEIDVELLRFVEGLAHWVRGNDAWSFETRRYFGQKGEEVRMTRQVALLPPLERGQEEGAIPCVDTMEKHLMVVEVAA